MRGARFTPHSFILRLVELIGVWLLLLDALRGRVETHPDFVTEDSIFGVLVLGLQARECLVHVSGDAWRRRELGVIGSVADQAKGFLTRARQRPEMLR